MGFVGIRSIRERDESPDVSGIRALGITGLKVFNSKLFGCVGEFIIYQSLIAVEN